MVHLVVHLVEEAKLGGPVHYRWMFPIERYLGLLKSYVLDCYLRQYRDILKRQLRGRIQNTEVDKKVHRGFVHWFANRIGNNLNDIRGSNDEDVLISLAQGPFDQARSESVSQPEYDNIQDLEADLEAEMDEFSSSAKNKIIRHFWTVNIIDDEGVVREQHLKVKELFAMNDGRRVITKWNRENQPIGE
ncbi:hypothetical protein RIF29_21276 [Crotalaria pallida]|uniref:DUF4218 domain-containing protein n=1 Tax=Crotalaria pallida TaxID=3830 RepID=A0AAN9F751_CROPI